MAHPRLQHCFEKTVLLLSLSIGIAACSSSTSGGGDGGHSGAPGTGGSIGAGGAGTGGSSVGSGGITGSGGQTGLGGAVGTGGSVSSGGSIGSGGKTAAGGAMGTGGKSGTGGSSGSAGDYGFTYRPVQDKQLDFLCTLHAVGPSTYVYVRLDQTGTKSVGIATVPVYTARLAQISVDGAVTDLANPLYDYGGGHHNDSLQVDYQGASYKYYHSSFGFGFRACQPMDCVSTPTTDGCTSARTLPEVCVEIKADGTHDPLTDKFKKCQGDSNP